MTKQTSGNKTNLITIEEFIIHFSKGNIETFNFCCELKKNYPVQILIPLFTIGCTSSKFLLFYNSICKNKVSNLLRILAFLNSFKPEEYSKEYKNLLTWNKIGTLEQELAIRKF